MLDAFKSLVLNYSYEPLQFCTARHAITMVFGGRAEELDSAGYLVRTPSTSFELPTVIRVLKMVRRNRKKGLAFSKKNILRRDNYTCQYCGISTHPLTVDHVVPKSENQIINLFLSSFHPDRIPMLKSGKNTCPIKSWLNLRPFNPHTIRVYYYWSSTS